MGEYLREIVTEIEKVPQDESMALAGVQIHENQEFINLMLQSA